MSAAQPRRMSFLANLPTSNPELFQNISSSTSMTQSPKSKNLETPEDAIVLSLLQSETCQPASSQVFLDAPQNLLIRELYANEPDYFEQEAPSRKRKREPDIEAAQEERESHYPQAIVDAARSTAPFRNVTDSETVLLPGEELPAAHIWEFDRAESTEPEP